MDALTTTRESTRGTRAVAAAYALIAIVWAAVRIWAFAHAAETEFPDSVTYLEKAAAPLWTPAFFFGAGRFFVVPLVYRAASVLGPSKNLLTAAQLAISLAAWLLFAWTAAAPISRRWLGVASFASILVLGLTSDVVQWDTIILSESVTTSAFVAVIAACLALGARANGIRAVTLGAAFAVFSLTREANSLLLLPIGASLMCWAFWYLCGHRRQQLLCAALASLTIVLVFITFSISSRGVRWYFPLLNVVGKRILPVPERVAFFEARGMPVNDTLRGMAGEFASGKQGAFYRSIDLVDFRAWVGAYGRQTYALDLLAHPRRTLVEPLQDVQEFVCPELRPYRSPGFMRVLPELTPPECAPRAATAIVGGTFLIGIASCALAYRWRRRLSAADGLWLLLIAGMLASWQAFVWMTWHVIGGMEVGRHVFSGVLQSRAGAVLLALGVARWIDARFRAGTIARAPRDFVSDPNARIGGTRVG